MDRIPRSALVPEVDSPPRLGVQLVSDGPPRDNSLGHKARAGIIKNPPCGASKANPHSRL